MIKNAILVGNDVMPERYNAEKFERGRKEFVARAHVLAEVLRNAQRWVRGYESPESKAKKFGGLYDCLLLTPMQYPRRYCITPATYTNKKGELSKWRNDLRIAEVAEWHELNKGLEIVDQDLNASVHGALKRLREDALITELIAVSKHQTMIVAEWHDQPTGLVVPVKCLIDVAPPADHPVFGESLWDVKTTMNAHPRSFARDAQKYRYDLQGGFYLDLWNAATGEHRTDFGHVVQENYPPFEYRTPPPLLTQRFLAFGKVSYQAALSIYCRALDSGEWPGYDRKGREWPLTDCDDWFLDAGNIYEPIEEPEEEEEPAPEPAMDVIP